MNKDVVLREWEERFYLYLSTMGDGLTGMLEIAGRKRGILVQVTVLRWCPP